MIRLNIPNKKAVLAGRLFLWDGPGRKPVAGVPMCEQKIVQMRF
jgi:hypothetical protein